MKDFDPNDLMQEDMYVSLSLSCDGNSHDCIGGIELPEGTNVQTEDEARSWAVRIAADARASGWTQSGDVIFCPECTKHASSTGTLPQSRYERARKSIS